MFFRHGCGPSYYNLAPRFGGFGGGPGGSGRGWGGFRGPFRFGRMLRDGDLRLVALALLEDGPRHGYDIIKALEERSGGIYSPSPGVVYPTMTFLEEAGYVTAAAEGNKKVYSITETGRTFLNANREEAEAVLDTISRIGKKMNQARDWFDWSDRESGASAEPPPEQPLTGAAAELDRARRRLRALIVAATEGTEDDQKRVAEILDRAADEILGRAKPSA